MSWHLMSPFDIFFGRKRRQSSMEMLWHFDGTQQDFYDKKGIPAKCHENVMKLQCHSIGLKIAVHFDGIFMEKVHGIVMEFDVIFDQNSDGNQWWHFTVLWWSSHLTFHGNFMTISWHFTGMPFSHKNPVEVHQNVMTFP